MTKMGRPSKEDRLKESRSKANTKYIKKAYNRIEIKLRKDTESDMIQFLHSKESIQAYIKTLIKKDMENHQK